MELIWNSPSESDIGPNIVCLTATDIVGAVSSPFCVTFMVLSQTVQVKKSLTTDTLWSNYVDSLRMSPYQKHCTSSCFRLFAETIIQHVAQYINTPLYAHYDQIVSFLK